MLIIYCELIKKSKDIVKSFFFNFIRLANSHSELPVILIKINQSFTGYLLLWYCFIFELFILLKVSNWNLNKKQFKASSSKLCFIFVIFKFRFCKNVTYIQYPHSYQTFKLYRNFFFKEYFLFHASCFFQLKFIWIK